MKRSRWQPLQRAQPGPASEPLIQQWMADLSTDRAGAIKAILKDEAETETWINNLYQVQVRRYPRGLVHINIRRRNGTAVHNWRHFQRIKNELVGPECEAVELYPAESRLVDTSNKFHLWCVPDPTFRFPFGWKKRDVQDGDTRHSVAGLRQEPLDHDTPEAAP